MSIAKNLEITILGKSFAISTDDDSDDVHCAATIVDTIMSDKIKKHGTSSGESQAAIITALQIATDFVKQRKRLEESEEAVARIMSLIGEE